MSQEIKIKNFKEIIKHLETNILFQNYKLTDVASVDWNNIENVYMISNRNEFIDYTIAVATKENILIKVAHFGSFDEAKKYLEYLKTKFKEKK